MIPLPLPNFLQKVMSKKHFFTFLSIFITSVTFSQGEANIWYFGVGAGLDFNSGAPITLSNSSDDFVSTLRSGATISNAAGQLLMYTDGINIFNRNHQIMSNGDQFIPYGINEEFPSTIIMLPQPGSTTLYYVFTTQSRNTSSGFRYALVDMSLDGGLGSVVLKNQLIYAPTSDKMSVVNHNNNLDNWIVTHGVGNNSFFAHRLTSSGLNPVPVISNIGSVFPTPTLSYTNGGQMKLSPNGTKLAVLNSLLSKLEIFDFNNSTGAITNPVIINLPSNNYGGLEFSQNSQVLYTTELSRIIQFDLTTPDIASTLTIVHDDIMLYPRYGSLQLGPDGKIYISTLVDYFTFLPYINNPDTTGIGCNFNYGFWLGNNAANRVSLLDFNQSYFNKPGIVFENTCESQSTNFSLNSNLNAITANWDFGDGSTFNGLVANHIYASSGNYTVSVSITTANGTITKTREIKISDVPTATQPQNMLQCDNDNNGFFNFDLTSNESTILNGQNASLYNVKYFANATDYGNNLPIATPSNYQNTSAYQQQTIIAEVSNNANRDCKATATFTIDVFDKSIPAITITTLTSCDNTSFGTSTDGRVRFDLTQRASVILNGQSASQFTVNYFQDAALTLPIATPSNYVNTNSSETIYVKVVNNDNPNCVATTSFAIEVFPLPVIANVVTLKQCDDNVDGFSVFNLTEANSQISANFANETFGYFETATEAQNNINPITNFTTYTNQIVSNDVVYVRVANTNGCFRVATLNLNVSTTQIPLSFTRSFTVCDDAILGTNTDGISSFDFSTVSSQIQAIFPVGQSLVITYYRNLADALAERNTITDIANYRNIGFPNTQNIYIRVDSAVNNDCLGLGQHITLNVERIPIVQPQQYKHCDDNQDGNYGFDTTNLQSTLLNGLTNVSVTYFDQSNNPLPSPLPNPFVTATQTIKAVVTNTTPTACNYQTTIAFVVDDLPEAFPINTALTTACDDELIPVNQDGKYAFDTSSFHSTILGSQTGMLVNYYDQSNNPLPSPLPNPFSTATQNVRVEVINPVNTNCKAIYTIPFVVNPVPKIDLNGNEIVCNQQTLTKRLEAGILDGTPTTDYTYVWKRNSDPLVLGTNATLDIDQEGTYTVEVTNMYNCSRTRTINVVASDLATITNVYVSDLSNNNTIVVSVTGAGDYAYSLDNITFQTSNTFENVTAGVYYVYVKDLNGCGTTPPYEVSVLGIPSYFTPNGDGFNDYWNIKGISATINDNTQIFIFDRLGKLIKQISPTSQGWDGTYLGQNVTATDYWYSIQLQDGKIIKGHFALKR